MVESCYEVSFDETYNWQISRLPVQTLERINLPSTTFGANFDASRSKGGAETDAVQAILARYLQRRLQGSQLSTPPPPAVLFSSNNQARARQAQRATSNTLPRNVSEKEGRERVEDYEDYEDDLESFEDSERSRTRFDLFAGKSFNLAHISSSASVHVSRSCLLSFSISKQTIALAFC
ncbi:hypothetical protein K0M31_005900 [Melipona bicolor]|uniref:Uncharacterized protein n=1 Tax=Melipona bicolor TaxID=60889 RepID=A0AA40FUL9_9HYME|nr:hypothetical protein K0M31_005900 [Melipona bicolor]